jgi:hypothetical protein
MATLLHRVHRRYESGERVEPACNGAELAVDELYEAAAEPAAT